MDKVLLPIVLVLAIIFVVPILVYGLGTVVAGIKPPEGVSAIRFQTGVLVSKLGTAVAFVLIFYVARGSLSGRWPLYAFLWWFSFLTGEIGETIRGKYTWKEAVAGVISETIYFPTSAYATNSLVGGI